MDDLDAKLLTLLAENARAPVATLARRLNVARTTVQARIERLERSGAIAGYTLRRGGRQDRQINATVLLQIDPRSTAAVLQRLRPMPQVVRVHTASGRFDLILKLSAATTEDLDAALDFIGTVPGVRSSESLIHLSTKLDRGG